MKRTACFVAAVVASGCGCDLEATEEELAGEDAKDCGLADGDRLVSTWACAIEAFESDKPFRVSWFGDSIDTVDEESLASNGHDVWMLELDENKGGGEEIHGWDCLAPTVRAKAADEYFPDRPYGYDYIACGSLKPRGNYYQVCGEVSRGSTEPLPFDP